jgi:hypothetical protein
MRPDLKNMQKSGKIKYMVMCPEGARNQERLYWRGSATIYWTALAVSPRNEVLGPD